MSVFIPTITIFIVMAIFSAAVLYPQYFRALRTLETYLPTCKFSLSDDYYYMFDRETSKKMYNMVYEFTALRKRIIDDKRNVADKNGAFYRRVEEILSLKTDSKEYYLIKRRKINLTLSEINDRIENDDYAGAKKLFVQMFNNHED